MEKEGRTRYKAFEAIETSGSMSDEAAIVRLAKGFFCIERWRESMEVRALLR
jgi:hypothetical protein